MGGEERLVVGGFALRYKEESRKVGGKPFLPRALGIIEPAHWQAQRSEIKSVCQECTVDQCT
jgi:hypothetical protein